MLPNWKNSIIKFLSICLGLALVFSPATGHSSGLANGHSQDARSLYWLKIKAGNKYQRSALARTGISLEIFSDDYVIAIGTKDQRDLLAKKHLLLANFMLDEVGWDFPSGDTDFHTYDRMQKELEDLVKTYPGLASLDSLGQSVENRQIWRLRISKDPATASTKPGIAYMGGHHAREHLSIEMPLLLAKYFLEEYKKGNADVIRLVDSRDIHIVPMVNP